VIWPGGSNAGYSGISSKSYRTQTIIGLSMFTGLHKKKERQTNKLRHTPKEALPNDAPNMQPLVSPKHRDRTIHCRYELKYRIPEVTARAVAYHIRPFIDSDVYATDRPDGQYPIASLYFDSNSLALATSTIEGRKNRFKLRIRAYDDNPATPCFFEVKRRINNVVLKARTAVNRDGIADVINYRSIATFTDDNQKEVLHQFQLYASCLNVRPLVVVKYQRQAFEDHSGNRLRITFDRNLSYMPAKDLNFKMDSDRYQRLAANFVVMEIKFTDRYPAWLADLVRRFNLPLTAMSKYVESLKQASMLGFCAPEIKTNG